jgi:hypothetical protein
MKACVAIPAKPLPSNRKFRVLIAPWTIAVSLPPNRVQGVTVPRGFVWDGASVPKAFRWLIGDPWECEFQAASLVHDYLYWSHKATKADADLIFRDLLISSGAKSWVASLMYAAVKSFAQSNYDDRAAGEFKILPPEEVSRLLV